MPTDGSAKPNTNISINSQNRSNANRNSHSRNSNHGQNNASKRATQNLNHLLAFTLPPRSRPPAPAVRRSRRGGGGTPFNKERYINAQYRFLVKPTGDYTAYFADSDIYLHWGDILQVMIPTTSALSTASTSALSTTDQTQHEGVACPICLSPPTAPRMTKCGHVYCYPCILRYLTLADGSGPDGSSGNAPSQKWRRCPICWDAVYARDLKAVQWWDPLAVSREHDHRVQAPDDQTAQGIKPPKNSPGEVLSMRLIERPHLTTLALPQSSSWPSSNLDHPLIAPHSAPWHFQPDVMGFAKFMLATPDWLIDSLTRDLLQLEDEIRTLKSFGSDALGLEFVNLAEQKVKEQINKVQTELDTPYVRSTIGQVKNDLKEHEAAQSGSQPNHSEHLSRRQRKKLERGNTTELPSASDVSTQAEDQRAQETDGESDSLGKPEEAPGTEEFLALRSHGLNGIAFTPQNTSGAADADVSADKKVTEVTAPPQNGKVGKPRKNLNPPAPSSSTYLFFQAASGQNIFLHPLDIKVLLAQYGSYAALPRDLKVKVQGADEGSMNEELRRRCKYLSHIPMAADVVFIEVDWESMDHINKANLKPYEQALRQRKGKRRDKARREDRAKSKAEEAEMHSRLGGGGAAAAAMHRQKQALMSFDDEINFPSDGLSRSYGSNGAHDDGSASNLSVSPGLAGFAAQASSSPSFREAALWGAEREFPIHPGASALEDFPDSLGPAGDGRRGASGDGPAAKAKPMSKTVWGTPAAKSSFAKALHGGSRDAEGIWDDQMDDAWHELEEDFIIGATNSGRRPSGSVKEGRGLNRQPKAKGTGDDSSGTHTPKTGDASGASTPGGGSEAKPKKVKKKLVLTSGGRGAW